MSKKIIFISLFSLSLLINCVFGVLFLTNINEQRQQEQKWQADLKISNFRDLFIQKVLLAEKEVDFESRLALETAVRELNDDIILAHWQRFTESETKEDASYQAKQLLLLLINKTSIDL